MAQHHREPMIMTREDIRTSKTRDTAIHPRMRTTFRHAPSAMNYNTASIVFLHVLDWPNAHSWRETSLTCFGEGHCPKLHAGLKYLTQQRRNTQTTKTKGQVPTSTTPLQLQVSSSRLGRKEIHLRTNAPQHSPRPPSPQLKKSPRKKNPPKCCEL